MSRYLKVSIAKGEVKDYRELTRAEHSLKACLANLPRNSTNSTIQRARQRAMDSLRAIRFARGRQGEPMPLQFLLEHRSFKATDPLIYTASAENRKELLQYVRRSIQEKRRYQRHVARIETLNLYSQTPPPGVKHAWGLYVLAQKMRAAKIVFNAKKPRTDDQYLGIELEFISPANRATLAAAICDAGLSHYVHLHQDGSVRANEKRPGEELEISLLVRQTEVFDIVPRLIAVLDAHKCYVNATCGMHVHLDMRQRDPQRSFAQLVRAQPILYGMCPPSRKTSQYCKPTRGADLAKHRRSGNRYKGINACAFAEHRTLEVRIHSGTLSVEKITNWVRLLLAIVDCPNEMKQVPRSLTAFARRMLIPDDLKEYIAARTLQFTQPSVETDPTTPIVETAAAIAA